MALETYFGRVLVGGISPPLVNPIAMVTGDKVLSGNIRNYSRTYSYS